MTNQCQIQLKCQQVELKEMVNVIVLTHFNFQVLHELYLEHVIYISAFLNMYTRQPF